MFFLLFLQFEFKLMPFADLLMLMEWSLDIQNLYRPPLRLSTFQNSINIPICMYMYIKWFGTRVVVSPSNKALQSAGVDKPLNGEGRYLQIGRIAENKEHIQHKCLITKVNFFSSWFITCWIIPFCHFLTQTQYVILFGTLCTLHRLNSLSYVIMFMLTWWCIFNIICKQYIIVPSNLNSLRISRKKTLFH